MRNSSKNILPFITNEQATAPGKRLFIGLICANATLLCLLLLAGWIVPYIGFGNIHPSVPYITGALFFLFILLIIWAVSIIIAQAISGKHFWGATYVRGWAIKCFLPLMELLARSIGISTDEVRCSFIKVNNQLVLTQLKQTDPARILILLPHCIQQTACPIRLSYTINACKRCGNCPISGLLAIRDAYGVQLAVATGGSIARRIVVETRPKFIIAVACERDLAAGIQDTHPLPVFGILNHRPDGPCRNTQVNLQLVVNILEQISQKNKNLN